MKDAVLMFEMHCIEKLEANRKKIEFYVENSLMLVTALAPKLGYDLCAKIAHKAMHEGLSLKEACLQLKALSSKEFDELVIPEKMTRPNG
jgi:fumarate hydratase class II